MGDLTRDNFSFSSKALVGEFLQPRGPSEEPIRLSEQEIILELKALHSMRFVYNIWFIIAVFLWSIILLY